VAEICRALDGLPLALELAAPLVRQMPLDELARRVREQVLMPASGRGRDTRHATVRAAIEWSHRLLEPAQRVWFERLGVFSGGFTLTAAERLCGIVSGGEEDMVALLSGLVDKSLLALEERAGGFRYRMLGTIRRFALEQLSSRADEAQVRGAHLEVFAELVRTLDPQLTREHAERFEALDLEQDNFRAALTWAEGQPEQADRFGALATALVPLWRLRAQLAEGRRWLASAAERATQEPLRAAAGLGEGSCALLQGDYAHAGGVLTEALKRYEELGDVQGAARCLHALGQVEAYRGHHERADAHFDEAVKKLTLVGHAGGLAEVHHEIGRFARFRGDYAMARENLERSLALCEDLGDVRGRADALHELGRVARRRGEPEAAGERLGSALRLYSELGDRRGIAKSNYALGSLAQESGDLELAGRHFNDAVNSFREVGDRQGLAWPLRGLGMIASARQELDEAQALFQEMLAIGQAIDSDPVIMSALAALGDLAEARGDVEAAAKLLRDALDVGGRVGYEPELRLLRERIANLVQT
jgi:predicted ATPase